jgi:hypothetical protein
MVRLNPEFKARVLLGVGKHGAAIKQCMVLFKRPTIGNLVMILICVVRRKLNRRYVPTLEVDTDAG